MSTLAAFSQERPVLGLAEIRRRTGLSSSTTHRLVGELVDWGALARTGDFQYRIGPMLRRLGAISLSGTAESSYSTRYEEHGRSDGDVVPERIFGEGRGMTARPESSQVPVNPDGTTQDLDLLS